MVYYLTGDLRLQGELRRRIHLRVQTESGEYPEIVIQNNQGYTYVHQLFPKVVLPEFYYRFGSYFKSAVLPTSAKRNNYSYLQDFEIRQKLWSLLEQAKIIDHQGGVFIIYCLHIAEDEPLPGRCRDHLLLRKVSPGTSGLRSPTAVEQQHSPIDKIL